MSVTNNDKKYLGIIWTGLYLKELNEQLTSQYGDTKYLGNITVLNNKQDNPESNYTFYGLEKALSSKSIFKGAWHNRDISVHHNLKNYPFTIELKIKPAYFITFLGLNIFLHTIVFLILMLFFALLYKSITNYYKAPLFAIFKRLNYINYHSKTNLKESDRLLSTQNFSPNHFVKEMNNLLDHYYLLQEEKSNLQALEIRNKVLDLALTEQHFVSSKKSNVASEEKLYLNKLLNIIEEDFTTTSLARYLTEVTSYCGEFYHEVNCEIIVLKQDDKPFSFKNTALTETIFNIFTFIIRGNFEVDSNAIIIKGEFTNDNDFPLITIETTLSDDSPTTLGWMSGPSYVYSGLLSIHLLAKENNLLFNIKRKNNKLLFVLESVNDKIEFYKQAFEILPSSNI